MVLKAGVKDHMVPYGSDEKEITIDTFKFVYDFLTIDGSKCPVDKFYVYDTLDGTPVKYGDSSVMTINVGNTSSDYVIGAKYRGFKGSGWCSEPNGDWAHMFYTVSESGKWSLGKEFIDVRRTAQ